MAYNFNGSNQYLTTASAPATVYPVTLSCLALSDTANGQPISINNTSNNARLAIQRITTNWRFLDIGTNTVSFDLGSVNNGQQYQVAGVFISGTNRVGYFDGGNKTTNTADSSSGQNYNAVGVGARFSSTWGSFFDGRVAEVGIWDVDLTDDEIASLGKGFKPYRIRPQNLVFYAPLVRNIQDTKRGVAITNNNTATVAVHPRVY